MEESAGLIVLVLNVKIKKETKNEKSCFDSWRKHTIVRLSRSFVDAKSHTAGKATATVFRLEFRALKSAVATNARMKSRTHILIRIIRIFTQTQTWKMKTDQKCSKSHKTSYVNLVHRKLKLSCYKSDKRKIRIRDRRKLKINSYKAKINTVRVNRSQHKEKIEENGWQIKVLYCKKLN